MNHCIRRIICLILLSFLIIGLFSGCRKSPLLEQVITIYQPEKKDLSDNNEINNKDEEKPADNNTNTAENATTNQLQVTSPVEQPQVTSLEGIGDAEYGADLAGEGDGSPQVVTDSGIAVTVPESRYMVTTVSEGTQNPHWKSSIIYDSAQYTGERKDGIFEGQGTYLWDDGEKYTGEWNRGMYDGQGTYTWANGDKYEGQWKTEVFEGQGTYTWVSGSFYTGEWKAGVKEGQGTYTWTNGDRYEGQWKAGVKEGQGTYTWADGSVYEGEWKYGIKEGQGTYKGADGTVYEGLWANDKFVN